MRKYAVLLSALLLSVAFYGCGGEKPVSIINGQACSESNCDTYMSDGTYCSCSNKMILD